MRLPFAAREHGQQQDEGDELDGAAAGDRLFNFEAWGYTVCVEHERARWGVGRALCPACLERELHARNRFDSSHMREHVVFPWR